MDDGELPALAALRARGVWGEVTSPRALGDDGAWCSFATGVGPGRHGRRFQRRYRPGTYDWVGAPISAISSDSFWGALAAQGKRCVVFDVPKSPRGDTGGNVVVADWLAHHAHGLPAVVHGVGGLGAAAAGIPGDHDREPLWDCRAYLPSSFDAPSFLASLRERGAARTRAFLDVLAHDDFDVAIVVIGEAHCAGHQAWHDPSVVLDAYRDVDIQVAEIVAAAGLDAIVVAFSLLGMGPNREGMYLLDAVLRRLDPVEASRPIGDTGVMQRTHAWVRANVPGWARRAAPGAARRVVTDLRTRDVSRRRYWVVPADLAATAVRCNVVGREPRGTVEPGADFDHVCADLREALMELRDPVTGALLVREVLRADEIAPGPAPQELADLHVVWSDTGPLVAATSPRIGDVRVELPELRPGNHVEGGWFVGAGPGITHGVLDGAVSTLDFAPTVARLVGGHFDCDGVLIAALGAKGGAEDDRGGGSYSEP
jgi:predicted AlkP superfamily phosphohydrolase/phosphomutase